MRIKSFYASTVEGAVALARRELGEEAMLVESRRAPLEARHLGEYEAVCAVLPPAGSAPQAAPEQESPHSARLAAELAEMRRQLDMMGRTISRSAWSGAHWAAGAETAEWHARLMAADLEPELVHRFLETARRRCAPDGTGLDAALADELEQAIQVEGHLADPSSGGSHIAALVGPPGAGKTTMIAKLAVACGLAARRPLLLVSMDDYRVAGAEQLRSYAAILGVGFRMLDNLGALAQAIEEARGRQLVLIDTPGYAARDMERAAELAQFLASRPPVSTHLVLTASMKSADLTRVADRFEIFRPSSLLFTRLDETSTFGTALSLSVRLGKPISFLATGQEIPDDLEPATKTRIFELLGLPMALPERRAVLNGLILMG